MVVAGRQCAAGRHNAARVSTIASRGHIPECAPYTGKLLNRWQWTNSWQRELTLDVLTELPTSGTPGLLELMITARENESE